jgi:hypothetical protein
MGLQGLVFAREFEMPNLISKRQPQNKLFFIINQIMQDITKS